MSRDIFPITDDASLIAARDAVADVQQALANEWEQPTQYLDDLMGRCLQKALDLEESLTLAVYWRAAEARAKEEPQREKPWDHGTTTPDGSEPADEHERRHGIGDTVAEEMFPVHYLPRDSRYTLCKSDWRDVETTGIEKSVTCPKCLTMVAPR